MKATAKLLVAAVAAGGTLLAADAQSQERNPAGRADRGTPAAQPRSSAAPTNNAATVDHGSRGDGRGHGSGHRWGGHRHHHHHWGGYRHWSPRWSFYFGVPVLWGSWYWGAPYWHDYYPGGGVLYREVERDPSYPEHRIGPATTEVPRGGQGAPSQGPLYMNYCESAKAYFPKVTSCPEGWKLATPTS